jgi:hypothetical protein
MSKSFETSLSMLVHRLHAYEANSPGESDDNLQADQNSTAVSAEGEDAKERTFLAILH